MGKRSKDKREAKELRREVEILKAQLTARGMVGNKKSWEPHRESPLTHRELKVDPTWIKRDLLKTAILTLVSFSAIFALYLFGNQITNLALRMPVF